MVNANEHRAVTAKRYRLAGMCRSPEPREQHFRLEKEFLALAEKEECSRRTRQSL
jgi:hypothetical protein